MFRTSIYGNSGIVVSPGYPGHHGNQQDYTINITLEEPGPWNVSLSMTYNLQSSDQGCYDYFEVNGDGKRYCGTANLSSKYVDVRLKTWTVRFVSDSSVTREAGFLITYSV